MTIHASAPVFSTSLATRFTSSFNPLWVWSAQPTWPSTAGGDLGIGWYTFDSASVFFGFGTGRSPARFDNISITGTPFGASPSAPEITSITVSGNDLLLGFTGSDRINFKLTESADLQSGFADTDPLVTGTTTGGSGSMTYGGGAAGTGNFVRFEEN